MAGHGANPVTEVRIDSLDLGALGVTFGARFGDTPYANVDDITSVYSDQSYDFVPSYLYQGERLFSTGTTIGAHLFQNDSFVVDAQVSYRFDRLESEADDFYRTVEDRRQSLDGGFSGAYRGDWGEVRLTWLTDTLNRYQGNELDLTYRFNWERDKWLLSPFVSMIGWDSNLSNYYYSVSEAESRPDLPAYDVGDTIFLRAGINTTYRVHRNVLLYANFSVQSFDEAVQDSPIVDASANYQALLGFSYLLGNVKEDWEERERDRKGEWSWKVQYGYTTQQTFHKVHRGQIEQARDVPTYLVGATFGKLIMDGRKTDFWARASINRRLERDFGDDFFEYNFYGMMMGTGYSPWTNRELFRYGFGWGISYSDQISAQEATKQAERGEKTSRFLNYLEAQVDTPFSNIFGKNAPKNCYLGLSIVHRSGIFGSADIFNNVSGGSDVLAGHVECVQR